MPFMRSPSASRAGRRRGAAFIAALVANFAAQPILADELINVKIDQAKIIELPESTSTIIIGNPVVADVTMLKKNNRMILTGKSFGSTNLIALDAAGNAIGESVIRVSADYKGLIVQRGLERESWDCSPRCKPIIKLGDSGRYMGETAGQIKQHNGLASGK
jgi:Flp pilus assembly secretin CpaC